MTINWNKKYEAEIINFDKDKATDAICEKMRDLMRTKLHRRGLVIAVSGGIDSSVSAALAVKAFGAKKVFSLLLPEVDSSDDTQSRGKQLVNHLGIEHKYHDISPTLEAIGCYQWRDEAIKRAFPEYREGWKNKITIAGGMEGQVNYFKLVIQESEGNIREIRLNLKDYLQIVAATNYKQRIRKTIEYFHADRLNYAVVGTPNRVEYDQGFFVKNGDGSADIKPIAHLYKSQVYALARYFGLPVDICDAAPTTDTYSMPQGQDEFYFALPYQEMDKALWAHNSGASSSDLSSMLGISEGQGSFVYRDIETKRKSTAYLHQKGILMEPVLLPDS